MADKWSAGDIPSQQGKTAVVTGANSGLGLETSVALAATGATVIMACRNPARAQVAIKEVRQRVPDAQLEPMTLDVADLSSVRRFAEDCQARFPKLDLLCNNAGIMAVPYGVTRDNFELQIGTNHLGPFALTGLLLDSLLAAPAARIVTVSSNAHKISSGVNLEDLNWERRRYDKSQAYGSSKLANLLFTFELERRLRARQARAIAVAAHPGYADTNLMGPLSEIWFMRPLLKIGIVLLAQSAEKGALPTLYAATMPQVRGGEYFGPDGFMEFSGYPTPVRGRAPARDETAAARLWELSQELTGVRYL